MKTIELNTTAKKLLADIYTPVGIYLRLRDRFRDTILLESTDFHVGENSFSIIGINAIAGIEISNYEEIEFKLPLLNTQKIKITNTTKVADELQKFMQHFNIKSSVEAPVSKAQGLFGYTTFDAVQFFEEIKFNIPQTPAFEIQERTIPLMRYRLCQYVIV
ncbi:MAG: anthranilate synthase component I family protein, partial [Bacteroidota bacterium]|nr:anthranilate synthase component I family protein [Bacteroidota bacterium]